MPNYKIITDSCCDFTKAQFKQLDVSFASLHLNYKGGSVPSFTEPKDLHKFYEAVRGGEMPTTAAVNPDQWSDVMDPILAAGQDVLALGFSSGLSTTYQSAVIAAEDMKEKYPDRKIVVIDTLCAALSQGLLVWHAAKKRDEGLSLEELAAWVEENKMKVCHEVTVNDLYHLKRGGRVSATTALVGTMLNIKPMIRVNDEGKLETIAKMRGRKGAMDQLVKRFGQLSGNNDNETVFIAHGDCPEDAKTLAAMVKAKYPQVKNVEIGYVGGVIGAHTGPGVLVLFFMGDHR